ncbi:hypothetical protein SCOCK_130007 [Actinacidiphila cocklensis]|uniref:Uncharacterized protein n=1 Tax=Actinacidiphila cocklensis TaxID=887465 RepID=A0A9W4GNU3_9ACTN|nr:hypothetical protein SCOCK_130007 [Actinacidiphila cocklensis]
MAYDLGAQRPQPGGERGVCGRGGVVTPDQLGAVVHRRCLFRDPGQYRGRLAHLPARRSVSVLAAPGADRHDGRRHHTPPAQPSGRLRDHGGSVRVPVWRGALPRLG